jgi:hypothetical protein
MSLRFSYQFERIPRPVWPLGGRWVRPRPLIRVTAIGPGGASLGRVDNHPGKLPKRRKLATGSIGLRLFRDR